MQLQGDVYIAGRWQPSAGTERCPVINPYDGTRLFDVAECTPQEVDAAVAAARAAFDGWSLTSRAQRLVLLRALHAGLKGRAADVALAVTREMGMSLKMSQRLQAGLPQMVLAGMIDVLETFEFEERIGHSLVVKEPVGVVACITPWNYPLHQVISKIAGALAAGCTVVLKPSEVAPSSAYILAEVMEQAGFPPGVFNLVSGRGASVGETLVSHPGVDMVSFTGSTAAGKRIGEIAARDVKRVALELGGKSASVVLDDADLAGAVKTTVNMAFLNAGQTCAALTRLLVPADRHDEAAALAVQVAQGFQAGDPMDDKTKLGPLSSALQQSRVCDHIRRAIEDGAQLLTGGLTPPLEQGCFVAPTVFGRVDPRSALAQQEVFGPVLAVIPYHDEDDAVAIANDSPYGLAAAVWSSSDERALAVARRLRVGQVDINGAAYNPLAPFGGYKQSGHGRELGRYGLEDFLEIKSIQCRA